MPHETVDDFLCGSVLLCFPDRSNSSDTSSHLSYLRSPCFEDGIGTTLLNAAAMAVVKDKRNRPMPQRCSKISQCKPYIITGETLIW